MKKILILGAGFLQKFAIKKAKELGYYTLAVDQDPEAIGFEYADEFKIINIVDKDSCLKYAKEKKIDGVITIATDYGVLTASYIAEKMNLPGLNYNSAKIIKNKYLTRKVLNDTNSDDIKQFYEINTLSDLDSISQQIKFPVIVKPVDGSGSKGIKKVDNTNDLYQACKTGINVSVTKKVLIEDFIVGKEYGVESLVLDGEVHVLGVLEKEMTAPPYYAELGHNIPAKINNEIEVKRTIKKAINSLNINFGAVNMDVLLTKDGKVCIIDIGARMGGNLIGSHIIPLATGYDYLGNLIKASCADYVDKPKYNLINNVATKLLALSPGEIKGLPDFNTIASNNHVKIFFNKKKGDIINHYKNNLDGCGYVLGVGLSSQDLKKNVKNAKMEIDQNIIRI